jgi:hypothetical protein
MAIEVWGDRCFGEFAEPGFPLIVSAKPRGQVNPRPVPGGQRRRDMKEASSEIDNDKVIELVGGTYDGSLIPISLFSRAIGRPDLSGGKVALSLPGGSTYMALGHVITEVIAWPAPAGEEAELVAETREAGEELREFYGPDFEKWYCIGELRDGELIPSHYAASR